MNKAARFVVIINDNVVWMESQALQFYERLFKQKELALECAEEKFSQKELFRIQNDFSIEILMVYEGENPQSFLKLDSSRLSNENLGAEKAICLKDIIYFNEEDITVLFKRAEEIALQRKHDLIWIKAFSIEEILIKTLKDLEYEEFEFQETASILEKQIYFKKKLRRN
ncbi:hypothetical protein L1276_000650 [Flavobacterium sp. HSC-32F16]|uniref:hypothetical protein n=1 Tax=Flavobacterium sp. HSC-32F16 TaxID=2910964 RepID=UPI0020A389FA|nr:hypothetical protein [Flavobacterium sp. HSC-32F16]MCP2025510.1 hypothetical protein [Flavobacterium sp. HSC-32F16]